MDAFRMLAASPSGQPPWIPITIFLVVLISGWIVYFIGRSRGTVPATSTGPTARRIVLSIMALAVFCVGALVLGHVRPSIGQITTLQILGVVIAILGGIAAFDVSGQQRN